MKLLGFSAGAGRIVAGAAVAAAMTLGLVETSSASTCASTDVMIDVGISADSCGSGPTGDNIANTPGSGDPSNWDVNLNGDGGGGWQFFSKADLNAGGVINYDGDTLGGTTELEITSPNVNDANNTGTFAIHNASDPFLIVLGGGATYEYTWYLFTGLTGELTGSWTTDAVFGGMDLSNISVYTKENFPPSEVPVPAAVWLFGSGLVGLAGVARRGRKG
jgi:hypothetical protein